MDLPDISIVETDGLVFLRGQPNRAREPVDEASLRALLAEFADAGCVLDDSAIATAVQHCNGRPDPFAIQVAQRYDAQIHVRIAKDDMVAEISIAAACGGRVATVGDIIQALTQAGVLFGIDDTAMLHACDQGACSATRIAVGTMPQDGVDAWFEELIPHTADRAPKVDENGLIDYREHGAIEVVSAGMPLMRRHPATMGNPGRTVRGRTLTAKPGRDEPFASQLVGAHCDASDPNLLVATQTGQPVRISGGVMVEPVLQVAEVNMASGNIHFEGSVQVKGDVVAGMTVQASGDILVAGMVDGGVLEAGGDIRIAGGVIAHAKLHASGAIQAKFAQGVQIQAGTVLAIADMAMDCQLTSLNQILIGAENPGKARLVGGSATAMMLVSVPLLGSSKATVTKVSVGSNSELMARYAALEKRIAQEKETEESLEKLIKQVMVNKDPKGMLPRIQASRQHAIQVWGQSLAEKRELEAQIAFALTAKIVVGTAVEGAVDMSFGNHATRIRKEYPSGTFALDPAELVVSFADAMGRTTLLT